jgi:hypothetical protein
MKKQISEKMNSIQEVFNSMEKFNINHTVYTNNAFDTEILLSMVRMIDKIDSTLIDNNIEFLIDETIHYSNAINSNNYFIIKGLTKFKSDVLFLTKKIYNEYVKNTSIILKDGKNYLSS